MISGNVPNHLIVGARTGFLTSLASVGAAMPWQRVALQVPMTAKSLDLVDLGGAPMPTDSATGATLQDFIEGELLPFVFGLAPVWLVVKRSVAAAP